MVDQTIVSSKFGLIFFLAEKKIGEESWCHSLCCQRWDFHKLQIFEDWYHHLKWNCILLCSTLIHKRLYTLHSLSHTFTVKAGFLWSPVFGVLSGFWLLCYTCSYAGLFLVVFMICFVTHKVAISGELP
jgi:hypothetical protein